MLSFHKFSKENIEQMPALTSLCFGRNITADFYNWKYYKNPEGEVIGYIAKNEKNELVGFWGAIPESYYVKGEKTISYLACDTMTHPDYRRMGIFEKLAKLTCDELKMKNAPFYKVFPNEIPYYGYVKKLQWKSMERIKPYFKFNLQLQLEAIFKKKTNAELHFSDSDSISTSIDDFDKSLALQFPIIKTRNKSYWDWRFSDPSNSYRILYCYKNETLMGYCIYCIEKNSLLLIKDICALNKDVYCGLLNNINLLVINKKLKGIYCWSNKNSFYSKLFKDYFFLKNPLNKGIMAYPFYFVLLENKNISPSDFYGNITNWNLLPIDYDG